MHVKQTVCCVWRGLHCERVEGCLLLVMNQSSLYVVLLFVALHASLLKGDFIAPTAKNLP